MGVTRVIRAASSFDWKYVEAHAWPRLADPLKSGGQLSPCTMPVMPLRAKQVLWQMTTYKQGRRAARKAVETQETTSRRTNSDVVTVATSGGT